jgi:hypothetical protein
MKLAAAIARSLQADMQAELRDLERAVAAGTRSAGQSLKTELRRQVSSAGLGQEFTLRQVLLNAAKNGYGPSAAGTSSRAEGPNTAEPAAITACRVPGTTMEPTGGSARTASTP